MIDLIGYIGAFFFAICSIPQIIQVYRTNDTRSLSMTFLMFWLLGEIFSWIYVFVDNLNKNDIQYPLHLNYFFNFIGLLYLIYKKMMEKK